MLQLPSTMTISDVLLCTPQAGSTPSVTLLMMLTTTYCAPLGVKECDDPKDGNGTPRGLWADTCGKSTPFDATYRANTHVYAKTEMKVRPKVTYE